MSQISKILALPMVLASLATTVTLHVKAHTLIISSIGSIATSASLNSVIQQVKNSLSELISEAEVSASVVGFSYAADAKILLQNLDQLIADSSGKVFGDLNETQQDIFNNLLLTLDRGDISLKDKLNRTEMLISNLGSEISRIPFVDNRPLVQSYNPAYILNSNNDIHFSLSGSLLNVSSTSLKYGEIECKLDSSIENSLRFTCPSSIFEGRQSNWVSGQLTLSKYVPWYLFWKDSEVYRYNIGTRIIPMELGSYTLRVWEKHSKKLRKPRTVNNEQGNGHCQGDRSVHWKYRPEKGCSIDLSSVDVKCSTSTKSTCEGIIDLTSDGFGVRGVVKNNGSCGPFEVPKDGRGNVKVEANWDDLCPSSEVIEVEPKKGTVFWNRDGVFNLSSQTQKFELRVRQSNGELKVITDTAPTEWFTVEYNTNNQLLLKPRMIEEAFSL